MNQHNDERTHELVIRYLREFRKYGDMLNADDFDKVVAHNLGLDPHGDEFHSVQQTAEELITTELTEWREEKERTQSEPLPACSAAEDVQYINVDFCDMEDEEMGDDDWLLADKRLDIQVYHLSNE